MAIHDFNAQRLFVDQPLGPGTTVALSGEQANYLVNVLRMRAGDAILVFNGRDGEWRAVLAEVAKRRAALAVGEQARPQEAGPDIDYLFAPLKRARLDYMVQKAVEMGVARLRPVITRHTVAERVNLDRMRANAIEAAEQCGILRLPDIVAPARLDAVLTGWDARRRLIFCDEAAPPGGPLGALAGIERGAPVAVLVGPEGGFSEEERARILALPQALAISLGPRIMRADTAAVAALALVNAVVGDWG
ncbi:MAG: 16S rRNA (uracil(1498)-N(3))-methyltransferase [Hyphomicrobiaceae bacterium]|nr:16S rRNA (uracil(1498)-N(3))-methyltransferase [Hyphomicrobiaceae bacterium]